MGGGHEKILGKITKKLGFHAKNHIFFKLREGEWGAHTPGLPQRILAWAYSVTLVRSVGTLYVQTMWLSFTLRSIF